VHWMTIVGARPQFIKAAAVMRAMQQFVREEGLRHTLVHTGQHYDDNMSRVFFEQLGLPKADVNLGIGGGLHGAMTGEMIIALERILLEKKPEWVLIYGDTNSTLAAAIAAVKLDIPVAHVEAGLRSFNRQMPEEINRVIADHVSDQLYCPTDTAVENLRAEGIVKGVDLVGDVMFDAALHYRDMASDKGVVRQLGLVPRDYILVTCHRAENTDDPDRLSGIVESLGKVAKQYPVVWPLHPRTRDRLEKGDLFVPAGIKILPPLGYLEMLDLEQNAFAILTDSGGVQKEAYFFGVPCITMRPETEWIETVETGWNVLVDAAPSRIEKAVMDVDRIRSFERPTLYGDGNAARKIVDSLVRQY
jgi:UDP-GlcNAc3NAcA epimerase